MDGDIYMARSFFSILNQQQQQNIAIFVEHANCLREELFVYS